MNAENVAEILKAMRADCIPAGVSDRWEVAKKDISQRDSDSMRRLERNGLCRSVPPGPYTWLHCYTERAMMEVKGEVVMNDFPCELKKHLGFILQARGVVLVTGLGLGCVVRGLLAKGDVEHIDVVERSLDVIKLCGHSIEHPKVTLHVMDASEQLPAGRWDAAWHDLWSDPEKNEPHLRLIHTRLMVRCKRFVKRQGAWALPRWMTRRLPRYIG